MNHFGAVLNRSESSNRQTARVGLRISSMSEMTPSSSNNILLDQQRRDLGQITPGARIALLDFKIPFLESPPALDQQHAGLVNSKCEDLAQLSAESPARDQQPHLRVESTFTSFLFVKMVAGSLRGIRFHHRTSLLNGHRINRQTGNDISFYCGF